MLTTTHRTNNFLDEMNTHFFQPRGLYAMLVTYKPSRHSWSSAPMDISHDVSKAIDTDTLGAKLKNDLKFTSGKTHTELELPEAAPLIFPRLDAAAEEEESGKKPNAFKKSGRFIGDYMDRRANAVYNAENPDSSLSTGTPQFKSRYADPNHPANSGSLISLVTGGKVDPRGSRQKSQSRRGERGALGLVRGSVGYIRREKPVKKMLRQVSRSKRFWISWNCICPLDVLGLSRLTICRTECDVSDDCEYAVGGGAGDCEARNGRGEKEEEKGDGADGASTG